MHKWNSTLRKCTIWLNTRYFPSSANVKSRVVTPSRNSHGEFHLGLESERDIPTDSYFFRQSADSLTRLLWVHVLRGPASTRRSRPSCLVLFTRPDRFNCQLKSERLERNILHIGLGSVCWRAIPHYQSVRQTKWGSEPDQQLAAIPPDETGKAQLDNNRTKPPPSSASTTQEHVNYFHSEFWYWRLSWGESRSVRAHRVMFHRRQLKFNCTHLLMFRDLQLIADCCLSPWWLAGCSCLLRIWLRPRFLDRPALMSLRSCHPITAINSLLICNRKPFPICTKVLFLNEAPDHAVA